MQDSLSPTTPRPKHKLINPVEAAIRSCFDHLPGESAESVYDTIQGLVSRAPKRWVVYSPLVLLPSGSFDEKWWSYVGHSATIDKDSFWKKILFEIGKREGKGILTHLAVNAGIPLNQNLDGHSETENIFRTPSGLVMLHGNFGPALSPSHLPNQQDFEDAFWVSTKQNGITQVWAPRYTMFSRGNFKEKARLLEFHRPGSSPESRGRSRERLQTEVAVDLYAGIGYFVFSYVKMGIGKVLGWELNPWSVEGLRRGAIANRWSVKVVRPGEMIEPGNEKIIVMLEDNAKAALRLFGNIDRISHVNCGLLPSSKACWLMALDIINPDGWLHLHENVGVKDIKNRTRLIEDSLQSALQRKEDYNMDVRAEHVELVKTFAPGVWHCVFDIYISTKPLDLS